MFQMIMKHIMLMFILLNAVSTDARSPNLIFLMMDQLRFDAVGRLAPKPYIHTDALYKYN